MQILKPQKLAKGQTVGVIAPSSPPRQPEEIDRWIDIQGPLLNQSARCEPIMRALPDWFGIEEAVVKYVSEIEQLPTFIATDSERTVGFLSVKQHNRFSAEIHVLGVLPEMHRQGIGRRLLEQAEGYLRAHNVEFLHLKTLSDAHPDESYTKTRTFYLALGFRPLEELTTLWEEENPCLLMVKRL